MSEMQIKIFEIKNSHQSCGMKLLSTTYPKWVFNEKANERKKHLKKFLHSGS